MPWGSFGKTFGILLGCIGDKLRMNAECILIELQHSLTFQSCLVKVLLAIEGGHYGQSYKEGREAESGSFL